MIASWIEDGFRAVWNNLFGLALGLFVLVMLGLFFTLIIRLPVFTGVPQVNVTSGHICIVPEWCIQFRVEQFIEQQRD